MNINERVNFEKIKEKEKIENVEIISEEEEFENNISPSRPLELGLKAEEGKIKYRKYVLIFLCLVLLLELIFINYIVYKIVTDITFITDKMFSYFITGIFINLFAIFKGITKYLYSDEKSSLLSHFNFRKKN